MKNIIIIIFAVLTVFIFSNAKAETLNIQSSGYYFTRFDPSDGHKTSDEFKLYDIDGIVSYCIEPDVHEGINDYIPSDWSMTGLSERVYNKINLIAYYGYSYPGHDTLKYRMATQGLIWQAILGESSWARFNTSYWERGANIDVEEEKNNIINLIDNHYKKPSFSNTIKETYVGDEIILEDSNNALSMFDINIEGSNSYEITENKITIRTTDKGQIIINMIKKNVYNNPYKIFFSNDHQNIYIVGNIDNISYKTTINVLPLTKVKIIKKSTGGYPLKDAIYEIYDNNNNVIEEVKTDEDGIAMSNAQFKKGKYYIKEKASPVGYELDTKAYDFNINGEEEILEIKVYDKPIEREVTIIKKTHSPNSVSIPEDGITFNILKKDEIFTSVTTDKYGYAKFILPYGIYTVKQLNTSEGYLKARDFEIIINEKSPYDILYDLVDEAILGSLEIIKVDSRTNEPLNGVSISIYDESDNLVGNGITDEQGMIKVSNLLYGKYYIIEDKTIEGYKKTNEKLWFNINTNHQVVKIEIKNDPIMAHLHINKTDNKNNPIQDVSFAVYNDKDELVSVVLTDEKGIADIELPYGKYYFIEYSTPSIYQENADKYYFSVDGEKEKYEYVVINVPKTYKSKVAGLYVLAIKIASFILVMLCKKRLEIFV